MKDEVDDYVLDENAGTAMIQSWSGCAETSADIEKVSLASQAEGTQCMATYITVKDDTAVTNETTNVMLSCIILGGVSQLFKAYNASSGMTEAEFKTSEYMSQLVCRNNFVFTPE